MGRGELLAGGGNVQADLLEVSKGSRVNFAALDRWHRARVGVALLPIAAVGFTRRKGLVGMGARNHRGPALTAAEEPLAEKVLARDGSAPPVGAGFGRKQCLHLFPICPVDHPVMGCLNKLIAVKDQPGIGGVSQDAAHRRLVPLAAVLSRHPVC